MALSEEEEERESHVRLERIEARENDCKWYYRDGKLFEEKRGKR